MYSSAQLHAQRHFLLEPAPDWSGAGQHGLPLAGCSQSADRGESEITFTRFQRAVRVKSLSNDLSLSLSWILWTVLVCFVFFGRRPPVRRTAAVGRLADFWNGELTLY